MAQEHAEAASETPDPDPDPEPDLDHDAELAPDVDAVVTRLLGRRPQGDYTVAVRRADGTPVVLRNAPFLHSGRPMPTRFWLIDPALNKAIGQLESTGGVKEAEAIVDPDVLAETHDRYRRERDRLIPPDHTGPAPSGGVGGTRQGVKCLHAHYAHHLAGGDDPVGRWVHERLREAGELIEGLVVAEVSDPEPEAPRDRFAAVEIGSGAVKAVIRTPDGVERLRFTADLLSNLTPDGRLSDPDTAEFDKILCSIAAAIESRGCDRPRVVATEAVRRTHPPGGATSLVELVADRLGSPLEILDGVAEAELGYRAVSGSRGRAVAAGPADGAQGERLVTFDIGYGSTEFATALDGGGISAVSLPIGAATITSAHLESDPPDPAELSAALSVVELHLDDIVRERPELAAAIAESTIVGMGAIRFVAEVELGVADGDEIDGYMLERGAAEELFRALATESHEDRAANPGLQPDHVDWIVGAMCILLEFMRRFGVDEIRVSTLGLLDGIVASIEGPPDASSEPNRTR